MKNLLIYGAGSIGRGYLPWVFPPEEFNYWFVDTNRDLTDALQNTGCHSYRIVARSYEGLLVKGLEHPPVEFDAVFTAVGPRNFMGLADRFMGTTKPIICCENDSRLPRLMREITGNPNVFYGIPDVISSNTAPLNLLDKDHNATVTEVGTLYIDAGAKEIGGDAVYLGTEGMHREWMAKLYIHNTPHCIAAYLGWQEECVWIWEAMEDPYIYEIVEGAMMECKEMIVKMYGIPEPFAASYARKELARFSNRLLCDPISRVAREPLRKLAKGDRLIGAASLCLQAGVFPENIIRGIQAALRYRETSDPDYSAMEMFADMDIRNILKTINVEEDEPVYEAITKIVKEGK